MPLTPADQRLVPVLRKLGIVVPIRAIQIAETCGLPIGIAASMLTQESGGGHNLWGHDPTIFIGGYDHLHSRDYGHTVTKAGYQAYLAERGPGGRGGMQGVGPCQLTYYAFQDEADEHGGCWNVTANMTVGFTHLAASIRKDGLQAGVEAYNGSGPAAQRYAQVVLARADTYARALGRPYR